MGHYVFLIIIYALFSLINIFTLIGYSSIFSKNKFSFKDNSHFLNLILKSIAFISVISILLNFFFPLNNIVSIIFITIGLIFLIKNLNLFQNKLNTFFILFSISVASSLMTVASKTYPDFLLYHLPYTNILDHFKIIFGLSNLDFRFGHTSIIQNIHALFSVKFHEYQNGFLINLNLSIIMLYFIYLSYLRSKSVFIIIFSLFSSIFFIIHGYRYGAYGNDFLPSILMCLLIIYYYEFLLKNELNNHFSIIILCAVLAFIMKITMAVGLLICIKLVILNIKKVHIFKISITISIILISLFFIKNIINTSCLIYPISSTCIDTLWKPKNDFDFASTKLISERSSSASKDILKDLSFHKNIDLKKFISDKKKSLKADFDNLNLYQKQNFIFYYENYYYNNKYNWLKSYFKYHFPDQIFPKIIIFSIILFLISLHINIFVIKTNNSIKTFFFNLKSKNFIILTSFMAFGLIMWFLNSPHLRYGIIYLLYFSILPSLLLFNFNLNTIEIIRVRKYLKFIFIIALTYMILKIIDMTYENIFIQNYSIKHNFKNNVPYNSTMHSNVKVNFPIDERNCSNISPLCIKYKNAFVSSNYNLSVYYNYIFVTNKN